MPNLLIVNIACAFDVHTYTRITCCQQSIHQNDCNIRLFELRYYTLFTLVISVCFWFCFCFLCLSMLFFPLFLSKACVSSVFFEFHRHSVVFYIGYDEHILKSIASNNCAFGNIKMEICTKLYLFTSAHRLREACLFVWLLCFFFCSLRLLQLLWLTCLNTSFVLELNVPRT